VVNEVRVSDVPLVLDIFDGPSLLPIVLFSFRSPLVSGTGHGESNDHSTTSLYRPLLLHTPLCFYLSYMGVRQHVDQRDGIVFTTFTCPGWLPLFERTNGYDQVYQCPSERSSGQGSTTLKAKATLCAATSLCPTTCLCFWASGHRKSPSTPW
jgi:hypothetical protein